MATKLPSVMMIKSRVQSQVEDGFGKASSPYFSDAKRR